MNSLPFILLFFIPLPFLQLKFPNFTYEAPSNMSDSASAFIKQLRAPPGQLLVAEGDGMSDGFSFEATSVSGAAGGAEASSGLGGALAPMDEMDL